jgi:hypothetical protein
VQILIALYLIVGVMVCMFVAMLITFGAKTEACKQLRRELINSQPLYVLIIAFIYAVVGWPMFMGRLLWVLKRPN